MSQRINLKIGDVFSIKLSKNKVGYFQYVAKDKLQLNSSVIRAFRTHYPIDANINIEEIVNDDIDFYAHTILNIGVKNGIWEKIGFYANIDLQKLDNIVFGTCIPPISEIYSNNLNNIKALQNWTIWKLNDERINIGVLPDFLYKKLYYGAIYPYFEIKGRMETGYFSNSHPSYEILKRFPRPDIYSFVKYLQGNEYAYLSFLGNYFDKGVIPINGKLTKITRNEAVINNMDIARWKFSDTNWKYEEFITEEEFYKKWDSVK